MPSPPIEPSNPRLFADLSGLRAVVTGGSRGIGRAIALEFARAGANLIIHSGSSLARAKAVLRQRLTAPVPVATVLSRSPDTHSGFAQLAVPNARAT